VSRPGPYLVTHTDHGRFNFADSFKHAVVVGALPVDFPAIPAPPKRLEALENFRFYLGGYLAPGHLLNLTIAVHAACEGAQLTRQVQ